MKQLLSQLIEQALAVIEQQEQLERPAATQIQIDRTKDPKHGDFATNIALVLAKNWHMKPRDLAEKIVAALVPNPMVTEIAIAGPGFINFFLAKQAQTQIIDRILNQGTAYGLSNVGQKAKLHIEFVSANPTGPLHVGHGRGAAYGATLANLFGAIGYQVHREYYVNDAGRQMDILAASVWLRYLATFEPLPHFPRNGYQGDYVIDIAQSLVSQFGDKLRRELTQVFSTSLPEDESADGSSGDKEAYIDALIAQAKTLLGDDYATVHACGLDLILAGIKDDLSAFGVEFDEWFSEKSLQDQQLVASVIQRLDETGHLYQEDGATWFRSTAFGDDKDRVLIRDNGQATYLTPDIAYHLNKFERGFSQVVDIFGADHHGYIPRLRAAIQALGQDDSAFRVQIVQFATLYRGEEKVQMSTRSGSFVTLKELVDEVGKDAARFFYVLRKSEQHMDFDLALAKSQSNDNPVYYVQYAHARICSVMRNLADKSLNFDAAEGLAALDLLESPQENSLIDLLAQYPELLQHAALQCEPHAVANYLRQLANQFHSYYNASQFIVDDARLRNARLCLIRAVQIVLQNALELLNISAPEAM